MTIYRIINVFRHFIHFLYAVKAYITASAVLFLAYFYIMCMCLLRYGGVLRTPGKTRFFGSSLH